MRKQLDDKLDATFTATLELSGDHKGAHTYVCWPDSGTYLGSKGLVKVRGTIDGYPFRGAFMPLGNGQQKLSIKAETRQAIGKEAGDEVTVHLQERLH